MDIEIFLIALGIAIFPIPIITSILILLTPKAKANSLLFLLGWIIGLLGVGILSLVLLSPIPSEDEQSTSTVVLVFKIILGLFLIYFSINKWFKSKSDKSPKETPKWMEKVSSFDYKKSFGIGFSLSGLNPKNIILIIAAATILSETTYEISTQLLYLLAFTLVASLGVLLPILAFFIMGDKSTEMLEKVKKWMEKNGSIIVICILTIIGIKLVYDGLSYLLF